MPGEVTKTAKIVALKGEIHSIHFANRVFWDQKDQNRVALCEYYLRQERLEEIRSELSAQQYNPGISRGLDCQKGEPRHSKWRVDGQSSHAKSSEA